MSDTKVAVRVLDLPGANGGCACCDLSLTPEYAVMMQQKLSELKDALAESYPGKAEVEYVDLRESDEEKAGPLGQLLVTKKYPTPLIVIGGEPKFAGSILVKKIVREVGALLGA